MSFRIADLIGDKILNTDVLDLKSSRENLTDKVSSTSDRELSSESHSKASTSSWAEFPRVHSSLEELQQRISAPQSSLNFLQKAVPPQPSKLATFDDYTTKLYSNMYYDQLYLPSAGFAASAASAALVGSLTYAGLDKALSTSYPSIYGRGRPPWPGGFYPPPPALSSFLYPPLVYAHYSKRKGGQVRFTTSQTDTLEKRFRSHKYLSPEDRRVLADSLKLSDRQVKTWFQNRRAKWRRCNDGSDKPEPLECHSSDSDSEQVENLSCDLLK